MTTIRDTTHDPALRSWVESANVPGTDFPIQNLPFGRFRPVLGEASALVTSPEAPPESFRIGVAIGDQVLDLRAVHLIDHADMNLLMAATPEERRLLRSALSQGLAVGSPKESTWELALYRQDAVEMGMPCRIGDYTDFYTGIHHATAVGKLFRPECTVDAQLQMAAGGLPRSDVVDPGQRPAGDATAWAVADQAGRATGARRLAASGSRTRTRVLCRHRQCTRRTDSGRPGRSPPVSAWACSTTGRRAMCRPGNTNPSARFSPRISRPPCHRGSSRPRHSLLFGRHGIVMPTIRRRCLISMPRRCATTARSTSGSRCGCRRRRCRARGDTAVRLAESNAAEAMYWTAAQLVAHHTVGGCNLQPGDLLGSGTLSGPRPEQAGSMLELSQGGRQPLTLPNGEQRRFLEDGDTLTLRARCERAGAVTIGFGDCSGTVMPAVLPRPGLKRPRAGRRGVLLHATGRSGSGGCQIAEHRGVRGAFVEAGMAGAGHRVVEPHHRVDVGCPEWRARPLRCRPLRVGGRASWR